MNVYRLLHKVKRKRKTKKDKCNNCDVCGYLFELLRHLLDISIYVTQIKPRHIYKNGTQTIIVQW